jgi:lipopolysaccharide transport system ATP-binding protein
VVVQGRAGESGDAATLTVGDALDVLIDISSREAKLDGSAVSVALRRTRDDAVAFEVSATPGDIAPSPGARKSRIRLHVERLDVAAGEYALDVGLYDAAFEDAYDFHWTARTVIVSGLAVGGHGVMLPPLRWSVEDPR